ncbi:uncharacterized protein [Halyomorpha halys]|uniref:uncharacterized protein n=1 Tax=Halyomorpha halys TaxID=286706 RepID=UPI0006D4FB5A|nr:uncharacterized protein LOC106685385 [Halyomorpha halys]
MYLLLFIIIALSKADDIFEDCQPKLADRCFEHFNLTKLLCYDEKKCKFNPNTICDTLEEEMDCAQDVIDTDCHTEGRNNFDRWINAILAVHKFVCKYNNNKEAMMALLAEEENGRRCWDINIFLKCVEEKTRVTHILDMLQVIIDVNECNWILIALTTCNVQAERCKGRRDFLPEIFHIFMDQIKCAVYCSSNPKPFRRQTNILIFVLCMITIYSYT